MQRKKVAREQTSNDPFTFVSEVTEEHAALFVASLFERLTDSMVLFEAIEASKIAEWPAAPDDHPISEGNTAAQDAFMAAQDQIATAIARRARRSLMDAFLAAVPEVLAAVPPGQSGTLLPFPRSREVGRRQ